MKMQSLQPHVSISGYVSSIIVLEDDNLYTDCMIPLVAKGQPSIVFYTTNKREGLVLYGQNIKPFEFVASGHLTMIAYFLYPHILKTFFGFNANEVTDLSIDLSLMQPAKDTNLKEKLINEPTLNGRLQLLNNYILKLSEFTGTVVNKAILFATTTIQKNSGLVSLKNIQEELNVTERTFQRLFEAHVGVSPKTFCKVCQFQPAFQQINEGQFSRLGDIAYQNGYADQSHLIRAFREFTNCSPTEYIKLSAEFRS